MKPFLSFCQTLLSLILNLLSHILNLSWELRLLLHVVRYVRLLEIFRVIAAMLMPPAELLLSIYPEDPTTLMKLCTILFGVLLDVDTLLTVVVDDYTCSIPLGTTLSMLPC